MSIIPGRIIIGRLWILSWIGSSCIWELKANFGYPFLTFAIGPIDIWIDVRKCRTIHRLAEKRLWTIDPIGKCLYRAVVYRCKKCGEEFVKKDVADELIRRRKRTAGSREGGSDE